MPGSDLTKLGFHVAKPISVWNKKLKFDTKTMFVSLAKATTAGLTQKWSDLPPHLYDVLSSINLKKSPGEWAWLLVQRATLRALYELVKEQAAWLKPDKLSKSEALANSLDYAFEKRKIEINTSFFDNPGSFPSLKYVEKTFTQWLVKVGIKKVRAQTIAARLPAFFTLALHHEWSENAADYAVITDNLDTPFLKAAKHEFEWRKYSAKLNRQVNEALLDEGFGLCDIYVRLRAYYLEKMELEEGDHNKPSNEDVLPPMDKEQTCKHVVDLHSAINEWLDRYERTDGLRIVSGGPGSGKSSFAKMLAAELVHEGKRLLYIPLNHFNLKDSIEEATGEFMRLRDEFSENPTEKEYSTPLILLFDGLDELAERGTAGQEAAKRFLDQLTRFVEIANNKSCRVQALVLGRELSIQSIEYILKSKDRIFYLLPLYLTKQEIRKREEDSSTNEWIDPDNLLEHDQREDWWEKYRKAFGDKRKKLPGELKTKDLDELTAEPLLIYLVVISFESGKIDFTASVTLNEVYHVMIRHVWERGYEDHRHRSVEELELEFSDFEKVMEEIAIAAWHGNGRKAGITAIKNRCTGKLKSRLEKFSEKAEKGILRLLTAFYFRKAAYTAEDGEDVFEFTHKSFGEFLVARHLIRKLETMIRLIKQHDTSEDEEYGWNLAQAWKHWIELTGATALDDYIYSFFRREVERKNKEADIAEWQQIIIRLMTYAIAHGMPMQELPRERFSEENRKARNAEETMLSVHYACAVLTENVGKIKWPHEMAAGEWLSHLQPQRKGGWNSISYQCLGYLDFSSQRLDIHDLYGANFENSFFQNSSFYYGCLVKANLRKTNFKDAMLFWANLERANLEGARLRGARLEWANLKRANLEGANLEGANLERANLEGARLRGARLEWANLKRANLEGARLEGTLLEGEIDSPPPARKSKGKRKKSE